MTRQLAFSDLTFLFLTLCSFSHLHQPFKTLFPLLMRGFQKRLRFKKFMFRKVSYTEQFLEI